MHTDIYHIANTIRKLAKDVVTHSQIDDKRTSMDLMSLILKMNIENEFALMTSHRVPGWAGHRHRRRHELDQQRDSEIIDPIVDSSILGADWRINDVVH